MIEKIGYIKNPLTVIAIFAALAEVSGTVVLPILDPETQKIYVWFLMGFPIFLVALFFYVLYQKHHVMYAPTDFKDDKTFKELFENSSGSAKVEKINSETEDLLVEPIGADIQDSTAAPAQPTSPAAISAAETLRRTFQGNGLLAEELVVAKLSKNMGLKFERNLAVKGLSPKVVFDAVATSEDRAVVVEVRFTRQGMMPQALREEYFERVLRFAKTLPEERRSSIEYVFALATDTEDEEKLKRMERTLERVYATAQEYPFKTYVHLYQMKDLEREFKVQ